MAIGKLLRNKIQVWPHEIWEGEDLRKNRGWNAFLELRRQALHNMQQLSADAEKAGSADMTLDEINAEIAAARSGK